MSATNAAGSATYFEVYRRTSIGVALMDSLDELITEGDIPPALALKVLGQFDKANGTALSDKVTARWSARGQLHTYNLVEEVWTLELRDAYFKTDWGTIGPLKKCKIVACKGTNPDDEPASKKRKKN